MKEKAVILLRGGIVPPRLMLLTLRLGMGWLFLQSRIEKLTTEGGWAATGFLTHAVEDPFAGLFEGMADIAVVDGLVVVGEILIVVALIVGAAVRWTSLAGSAMLLLFYLAQLPPEHGWMSERIIYVLGLSVFAAARAGTFYGVDGLLEGAERRVPALRYVLG